MDDRAQFSQSVRAATSVEELEDLLFAWRGSNQEALSILARHAPVLDRGLVMLILEGGAGWPLLVNPHQTDEVHAWMRHWLLNHLVSGIPDVGLEETSRILGQMQALGLWTPETEDRLLESLLETGDTLPERQHLAASLLLDAEEVRPETIDRVSQAVADRLNQEELAKLIAHPSCSTLERRRLVERHREFLERSPHVTPVLLESDTARLDPVVRDLLTEEIHPLWTVQVLRALAQDALDRDCREMFLRLMDISQGMAIRLLRDEKEAVARHLEAADLAPLLQSEDSRVVRWAVEELTDRHVHELGTEGLRPLLSHTDGAVRAVALATLSRLRSGAEQSQESEAHSAPAR